MFFLFVTIKLQIAYMVLVAIYSYFMIIYLHIICNSFTILFVS